MKPLLHSLPTLRRSLVTALVFFAAASINLAHDAGGVGDLGGSGDLGGGKKFSPDVEQRAEQILSKLNLRVSNDRLFAGDVAMINKQIADVMKQKRDLMMAKQSYDKARRVLRNLDNERVAMLKRDRDLNVQLAAAAGNSVMANNRVVAMINANRAEIKSLKARQTRAAEDTDARRQRWQELESKYAKDIAEIRRGFDERLESINAGLTAKEGQVALRVMATNHGVTAPKEATDLYRPVVMKLEKLEADVLKESIPLAVKQKTLVANVVVGDQTVEMIVDTGASVVCLPDAVARDLSIEVPNDAQPMTLVLADGNSIEARGVVLPSVRLGEFEATDVKAAVLSPNAISARPILGMTFLNQFRSQLDPAERTLTLERVELK